IAGNVMSTQVGESSAAAISRVTNGKFTPSYLQELPGRTIAVYTAVEKEGKEVPTTFTVECPPPYVYKPDGSGAYANHQDEKEMGAAFEWGLSKGIELMKRDATLGRDVDILINEYIRPGSTLQTQAALEDDDLNDEDENDNA